MKSIFSHRGFAAFICVAFINAFVDLGHKIIIQNTLFKAYDGNYQVMMTAVINALILLPFILLFTPAGYLADRYAKNKVMRLSALLAVFVTLMITWCYYQGFFTLAFCLTFVLALQSALYSPAKYGYIKELVGTNQLSIGNGWVQAVSMIAILGGIVAFSAMFELRLPAQESYNPHQVLQQIAPLGWLLVLGSTIEWLLALRLPDVSPAEHEKTRFDWSAYRRGKTLLRNLSLLTQHKPIWQSIIGLTLFWSISQVMLAVFPAYSKAHLGADNTFVIQGIMAMAGIGIMIGSMIANHHSYNHINLALIPTGAVGVTIGLILLPLTQSMTIMAAVFCLIGISGALLIVPLNALIQFHAEEKELGRILAGNNFIQNIGMLLFLCLTVAFSMLAFDSIWLLWGLVLIAATGTVLAAWTLPEAILRGIMSTLLARKYRLKVLGFEHIPENGKGVLLLGNHISWLDWAMIQMACPRHVHFVMDRTIYQRWYLKWFFDLYKVIPISASQNRNALQKVTELLNAGEVVCLFPEGAISHLGQMGEFKRGYEKACSDASGVIIPFYLRGMWGSFFSRSSQKLTQLRRSGLKRDVVIAFGPAMDIHTSAEQVKQRVFDISVTTWNEYADTLDTLPRAWIQTAKSRPTRWAVADAKGGRQSHLRLLTGSALLKRRVKRLPGRNIGLLVPTSSAGLLANLAALMAGKTVVNINYTASAEAQQHALEAAEINSIITARQFIKQLEKRGIDCQALLAGKEVFYLEDLKATIRKAEQVFTAAMMWLLPTRLLQWVLCKSRTLDDTAAILFSSGSEGHPKGVMLSQRNIMANLRQVSDVLNARDNDRIMATLPLFHAFGLTVTGLMPLVEGIPVICHPDPTDALNIGRAVAKYRATLMCATSTFLRLYTRNRRIHPLHFSSLRAVIAGAEKLDSTVRDNFQQRFMVPVIEGYGTTETTPVACVNLPSHLDRDSGREQEANRPGTVGMALPGTTIRIVDPQTLEPLATGEDGLILIGGAQIMQGYLNDPQRTESVLVEQPPMRWYKTGDKGHLDEDGFLTVVDRYSRFAKLGGEMVSLSAVENKIRELLQQPDLPLVAVNVSDEKKGEKIILLYAAELTPEALRQQLIAGKLPGLMLPAQMYQVDEIPLLGSGKVDFAAAKRLANDHVSSPAEPVTS